VPQGWRRRIGGFGRRPGGSAKVSRSPQARPDGRNPGRRSRPRQERNVIAATDHDAALFGQPVRLAGAAGTARLALQNKRLVALARLAEVVPPGADGRGPVMRPAAGSSATCTTVPSSTCSPCTSS
jgi:hypothetical protein